jgi:hypothetical protein
LPSSNNDGETNHGVNCLGTYFLLAVYKFLL